MLLIHFQMYKKNDGFNAQYDGVSIDSSKNIWIDHCHLKDTVDLSHVNLADKELTKWQTYDGTVREIVQLSRSRTTSLTTARNAYLWHAMQRCMSITIFTTQKMAFMTKNTLLACVLAR